MWFLIGTTLRPGSIASCCNFSLSDFSIRNFAEKIPDSRLQVRTRQHWSYKPGGSIDQVVLWAVATVYCIDLIKTRTVVVDNYKSHFGCMFLVADKRWLPTFVSGCGHVFRNVPQHNMAVNASFHLSVVLINFNYCNIIVEWTTLGTISRVLPNCRSFPM